MVRFSTLATWVLLILTACGEPDREPASGLVVPAARLASAEARARGRDAYLRYCALCHGETADGQGVRRDSLSGPPQDFTRSRWRRQTTPAAVYMILRDGKPGTSMPSFKALDESTRWDLVAYLLSVSEGKSAPAATHPVGSEAGHAPAPGAPPEKPSLPAGLRSNIRRSDLPSKPVDAGPLT